MKNDYKGTNKLFVPEVDANKPLVQQGIEEDDLSIKEIETSKEFLKYQIAFSHRSELAYLASQITFVVQTPEDHTRYGQSVGINDEVPHVWSHPESALIFINGDFRLKNPKETWLAVVHEMLYKLLNHNNRIPDTDDKVKRLSSIAVIKEIMEELSEAKLNNGGIPKDKEYSPRLPNLRGKSLNEVFDILQQDKQLQNEIEENLGESVPDVNISEKHNITLDESGVPKLSNGNSSAQFIKLEGISSTLDVEQIVRKVTSDSKAMSQGSGAGETSELLDRYNLSRTQLSNVIKKLVVNTIESSIDWTYDEVDVLPHMIVKMFNNTTNAPVYPTMQEYAIKYNILCYTDTSLSMNMSDLQEFVNQIMTAITSFREVEFRVDILYSDVGYKSKLTRLTNKNFHTEQNELLSVFGRGGTDLAPLIEFIKGDDNIFEDLSVKEYDVIIITSDFWVSNNEINTMIEIDKNRDNQMIICLPIDNHNKVVRDKFKHRIFI